MLHNITLRFHKGKNSVYKRQTAADDGEVNSACITLHELYLKIVSACEWKKTLLIFHLTNTCNCFSNSVINDSN